MSRITNSYTDDGLLKRYIQDVSTQTEFNKDKNKSIPIVVCHRAGNNYVPNYNTEVDLLKEK
jgi:hypothetical protein